MGYPPPPLRPNGNSQSRRLQPPWQIRYPSCCSGITLEEIGLRPDQIEEQRWRNASTLFWFTHSDLLSENQSVGDRTLPLFVRQPEVIFSDAWINPRHPHQALSVLHP